MATPSFRTFGTCSPTARRRSRSASTTSARSGTARTAGFDPRRLQTGTGKAQTTAISTAAITAVIFSLVDRSIASLRTRCQPQRRLYAASRAYAVTAITLRPAASGYLSPRTLSALTGGGAELATRASDPAPRVKRKAAHESARHLYHDRRGRPRHAGRLPGRPALRPSLGRRTPATSQDSADHEEP
jgi:hypothetical protein